MVDKSKQTDLVEIDIGIGMGEPMVAIAAKRLKQEPEFYEILGDLKPFDILLAY